MGKIIERYKGRQMRPAGNWKESRLVVAAASCVATATFMATIVIPQTTSVLRAKLEALEPAAQKIAALEDAFKVAEERRKAAERAAARAFTQNPFSAGTPYPSGLDRVVIGSSEREVREEFPQGVLDNDQGFITVQQEHPNIATVGYILKGKPGARQVGEILFILKEPQLSADAVREHFKLMFGPPAGIASMGRTWWKATPRENVEIYASSFYFVRPASDTPSWTQTALPNKE